MSFGLVEAHTIEAPRDTVTGMMERARQVQQSWATRSIAERVAILRRARPILAERASEFCDAISPALARNPADTLAAEVLPLLEACRFLERNAARILSPRRLGRRGRPLWLSGVSSEVHRAPLGHVLIIAPLNYPLFLAGVQTLQALAAGNAVTWKPGTGGGRVASLLAGVLRDAGLPDGLLTVTDESVAAAQHAIAKSVDKVFFTGSANSGRAVLQQLAATLTPCVAELSGCDAVFVLPSADLSLVVKALTFGMRLNGSATCMAPRRVILIGADESRRTAFLRLLGTSLGWVRAVSLPAHVRHMVDTLVEDAVRMGARVQGKLEAEQRPIVLTGVVPMMGIAQTDIFAPVLAVMEAGTMADAIAIHEMCPYALTASIFGNEPQARAIAHEITAGTVTINDLIVPTADPRIPFGGRRSSGFGVTRGAEGLLEMTAAKTIAARRGGSSRHFDATTTMHEELFQGVIAASHSKNWRDRFAGLKQMVSAVRTLSGKDRRV